MQEFLVPIIGIVAVIGAAAVSVIVVRFASVFAKRLEARPFGVALSGSGNWGVTGGARCHAGTAQFPRACPRRPEESKWPSTAGEG